MLDSSLACMVVSRVWRFVAVCAKFATRLGSSRSANFFGGTWTLLSEVHFVITFRDVTSRVTIETVGNDSWRVVTTRQAVTIRREVSPLLRPVTDQVYWTTFSFLESLNQKRRAKPTFCQQFTRKFVATRHFQNATSSNKKAFCSRCFFNTIFACCLL